MNTCINTKNKNNELKITYNELALAFVWLAYILFTDCKIDRSCFSQGIRFVKERDWDLILVLYIQLSVNGYNANIVLENSGS